MKPKRFFFNQPSLFHAPLCCGVPLVLGFMVFITGLDAEAGDILRGGGGGGGGKPRAGTNGGAPTPAASNAARANARDMLARTNRTLDSMRAMQNAARNAAIKGNNNLGKIPPVTLPRVPNGLVTGGLKVSPLVATDPTKWTGAKIPTQTVSKGKTTVTIKQTGQQALLNWETLNVGKNTALTFDQSKGGENVGQWIAFNKVSDPSANPTRILGNIKADGQVYIINSNGIIFGGSSQVNARGLTVSSLPINDNLINQGLLNNRDAQFLFSGLTVPGGADGTPDFNPVVPISGKFGDIVVQEGAVLKSPASSGGNGGRIMLVGPNVTNKGTISTEAGQTILAAGLQVGVAAHDGTDPSLRGLDVWVGAVGDDAGTATNTGIIEALTGSVSVTGRTVNQLGAIESSTSVNLNGRIDLKASYGAVANPNFDSTTEQGAGGPMFFNQFTGLVTMGEGSVSRILPDYASKKSVPGIALPERSQVNIEGLAIHFDRNSLLFAPSAEVSVRAGTWPYKDADGNRTIFGANGNVESGITNYYTGATQKFLFDAGQIHIDEAASINVAGSVDVFVPLTHSILDVELRGSELADSPLQRDSDLRGVPLTVDIRTTGSNNGKYWMGTPLGDVTGLAGLISRNAAQLTAVGGNISMQSGGSIVVGTGSSLDVSGGFFRHESGEARTSLLILDGRLVAIKDATPDQVYDGVFNGESVFNREKWGISQTFTTPLFSGTKSKSYVEGAAGGTLSLTAPSMALDGTLRGITVEGPRQRSTPPAASILKINFEADKTVAIPGSSAVTYIKHSPTPPVATFANESATSTTPEFSWANEAPTALPKDRLDSVILSKDLLGGKGFGSLEVLNPDGSIIVPENVTLSAEPKGSVTLAAANLTILGSVIAPGGKLGFTTYSISPSFAAEYSILNPSGTVAFPLPSADRGLFVLGSGARLSTAGLISDDRPQSPSPAGEPITTSGGEISIRSFHAALEANSVLDVSGGVHVSDKAAKTYGKGGSISLVTGNDTSLSGVIGGTVSLASTLRGYSGSTGGSLSIQAGLIEVGGPGGSGVLNLSEDFFRTGGFTKYSLTGIGAKSSEIPPAGQFEAYIPAVSITPGTRIRPFAENLIAEENPVNGAISLKRFINDEGLRSPVSLSFTALGSDDPFTIDSLEVRGDISMGRGASIATEPGASVSFKGGTVTLLGSVIAPGGKISVVGSATFPLTTSQRLSVTQALPTVHLGDNAHLSAAGVLQLKPDAFGRRVGTIHDGGTISVSGNILAEKGSLMDVSGASGILDLDPSSLEATDSARDQTASGLTSTPLKIQGAATRVDSNGGTIDLSGSQMLRSDATLLGAAGGATAIGGRLVVSSGRYYREGETRTGADINLIVTQSGNVILNPDADLGVGIGLIDENGAAYGNLGAFSLNRFSKGSFSSLSLGGKYLASASPVPYGGNVEFQGKIDLNVPGELRLAAGGIVSANDSVRITASYLSIGQDFRAPANPDDVFIPFQKDPGLPSNVHNFAPTTGTGALTFDAKLIDVGTLSLQNIGHAHLTAGGDIRGNGTFNIAGDVTFSAAKIYPTSLASFSIFAYDHATGTGSVTIRANGDGSGIPLSAGGSLAVYASSIHQNGILRAPIGSIQLGWDGTDLDPGDTDVDSPFDIIAGSTLAAPITNELTLGGNSVTSVSATTNKDDPAWIAPFGVSPDGQTWIDPRGVNVTLSGLPGKSIVITGESVNMNPGAVVDIRGGGELLASRWVPGIGGSMDLLGSASAAWGGGTEYQAGDLVNFGGATWSARVRHSGQSPTIGLYWSKVAESFAIIPSSNLAYAPYNSFNTGSNADSLAGDPGYVNSSLDVGDTITLDASKGLPAGTYTLLPRRYALLPGAFLVTPLDGSGIGTVKAADGSRLVSGYTGNHFNTPETNPAERSRFEIASESVIKNRVSYDRFTATEFLGNVADKLEITNPQQLPGDAGYAAFHGNSALRLDGKLRTKSPGLGAKVDISSFANITLQGGNSGNAGSGAVVLQTSLLTSWGAESLLIGGIRHQDSDGGASLEVRTSGLALNNPGGQLSASDVVLASKGSLTIGADSNLTATGAPAFTAQALAVAGDGTLLRVSTDSEASTIRTNISGATAALMTIGSAAEIRGKSVNLDSTYGTDLSSNVVFAADRLTLGSGQISVAFDGTSGPLAGSVVDPHLVLKGATLDSVLQSRDLTLLSYRSIDLYGGGVLGSASLDRITFAGSGVRGYNPLGEKVVIHAGEVTFENLNNSTALAAPSVLSGSIQVDAGTIRMGENQITLAGYQDLALNATDAIIVRGDGAFSTAGDLHAKTPLVTGEAGASYTISAAQAMVLASTGSPAPEVNTLGAGLTLQAASIAANTDILLPSGQLTLRATSGNVEVGGDLSVKGSSKTFNNLVRYSNAGIITLDSRNGNVMLADGSSISTAASAGGGNSGTLQVMAPRGSFASAGSLLGSAGFNSQPGAFLLDVDSLNTTGNGSLAAINSELDAGGFTASRTFRIRTGDVLIDHNLRSHEFSLAADTGSIRVTGKINSTGLTGGAISLAAHGDLILASGSELNVAAASFDSAGKGGSILLEAGTQRDGLANPNATLDLGSGATLDLSVLGDVAGRYDQPGSSAFEGKFTGTLHLRAPRTAANDDLQIASIQSNIVGASSVLAEGFKVYTPVGGMLNIAQRDLIHADGKAFLGEAGVGNANESAMRAKLLTGATSGLDSLLVIAPGVEIINSTGDLTLGLANITGSTNKEALAAADWDLSSFRYGSRGAPGVLTLRANGDLVFNNTLSDGFKPIEQGSNQVFADNGHSLMWMATLATISDKLPTNTQSWTYRLTAGADTGSSNFRNVFSSEELDLIQPSKGSVIVGEFYPAVPNRTTTGTGAAIGSLGQTADTIRISTNTTNRGNRYEVVRTGTGNITVSAGRDVQLRNQFSTIYTAGVALPNPTTVFGENDFVSPVLPTSLEEHPAQSGGPGVTLGAVQQLYPATWSMAGGNIQLSAGRNLGRYTMVNGEMVPDSTRQMPNNWLYRRGYVNSTTGRFAIDGGFGDDPSAQDSDNLTDTATSTTWWIDYSNFFQGIGALGGGNIGLTAGSDIVNLDAVTPTNARSEGRMKNPEFGKSADAPEFLNLEAASARLLELGGGDISVHADRDISGGVYYVERGNGSLTAGGEITTNSSRSISLGILTGASPLDPLTWLPTTLFAGKSHFDVSARGSILLGPVSNPFLLPQGLNNKFWYKSYFSTFSPDAGVDIASYGGDLTLRNEITLPGSTTPSSALGAWFNQQNLFTGAASSFKASQYQPWIRLTELGLSSFEGVFPLTAPNLTGTAFGGDLNIAGDLTMFPSASGNLELAASSDIIGLQMTGPSILNGRPVQVWTSATINLSDTSPDSLPSASSPLAYQSAVGRSKIGQLLSGSNILQNVTLSLSETGSYAGAAGTAARKNALHADGLHEGDLNPVRLFASEGDITGLKLFTPKVTEVLAGRDITDVALYLQNIDKNDVSIVSASRDIIPFNEGSEIRVQASNLDAGNFVGDSLVTTSAGTSTNALAGDIQINGSGVLEVLAGRNLDLGTGSNLFDGTGVGITSIGNNRNPNLPFAGADIIALAGVAGPAGEGPARGLSLSSMDIDSFIDEYLTTPDKFDSPYSEKIGGTKDFDNLTEEQQAIVALEKFYAVLREWDPLESTCRHASLSIL